MEEKYKDTDLREALRRKYSDTPQLPSDFMTKMQERMTQLDEPSMPQPATQGKLWRWVAAAACILLIIGVGITMLHNQQTGQTNDLYTQTNNTQVADQKLAQDEQHFSLEQAKEEQETAQLPLPTAETKANKPLVAEVHSSGETSPSEEESAATLPAHDANLHYATYTVEEDSTYQAPSRMDEFITKIADYNKVKAVPLDCIPDKEDCSIADKAYVFQDTKELDLFSRLFQAACWYDSKSPGYLLNFSQQQFFFTLKDLRKGEKYLWVAERIDGGRILLYSSHSPIEANVSSACYQKYREQLTHTFGTSHF